MIFEFTCDARVTRRIEATNRDNAQEQWKRFCRDIASQGRSYGICYSVGNFHVALLDGEPDVIGL